jgi:hypothetical protein
MDRRFPSGNNYAFYHLIALENKAEKFFFGEIKFFVTRYQIWVMAIPAPEIAPLHEYHRGQMPGEINQ